MVTKTNENDVEAVRTVLQKDIFNTDDKKCALYQLAWLFFLKYREQQHTQDTSMTNENVQTLLSSLPPHFRSAIDKIPNNQSPEQLAELFAPIQNADSQQIDEFNELDWITQVYSCLLILLAEQAEQGKKAEVFFTPQPVAQFMVEALNPKVKEKLYDPAYGIGTLFVTAHKYFSKETNAPSQQETFWGCEASEEAFSLGMLNMALHSIMPSGFRFQYRDALQPPASSLFDEIYYPPIKDVDVLLTHPPLGSANIMAIRKQLKTKLSSDDSYFLRHCMDALKKDANARCAMIISDKALSSGSKENWELRRDLFHNFNIQMIVGLPPYTFGEHSGYTTYILFFNKKKPTQCTLRYDLPRKKGPVPYTDFLELLPIWSEWNAYLDGNVLQPTLTESMWIEPYEELHQLNPQDSKLTNPYKLIRPRPLVNPSPPIDPRILIEQILQQSQEFHDLALQIQAALNKKEYEQ